MTSKEKASELYEKMWGVYQHDPVAIECALICVDEIIEALRINDWQNRLVIDMYEEVKQELNKL
tara:strand:- start:2259 stop:2450 length:192 start_codon:yes stop_codon:yes gene_type:complete